MWVIDPLLHKQIPIVEKWGFTYKTVAIYLGETTNKIKKYYFTGLGYWTRANTEMCLLAAKRKTKKSIKVCDRLVVSEKRRT